MSSLNLKCLACSMQIFCSQLNFSAYNNGNNLVHVHKIDFKQKRLQTYIISPANLHYLYLITTTIDLLVNDSLNEKSMIKHGGH